MTRLVGARRLVVRAPSWLGDFVMAEPALRALHRRALRDGAGAFTLIAPGRWLELLGEQLPGARAVALGAQRVEEASLYRGHDLALLLNGSARSACCAVRAGVRERVGLARGGRGALFTCGVRPALERGRRPLGLGRRGRAPRALPRPFGAVCAELAGLVGAPVTDPRPRLAVPDAARAAAARRLASAGVGADEPYVLLNAAARAGSAKAFPGERWREVVAGLAAADAPRVLVVGAPGEEHNARAAAAPGALLEPAPELAELCALIERAACFLTADGGPRHLAVALDRPLVVVFGPTDPRHTADHLERTRSVRVEVECGPCHRERCPLPAPSRDRCMLGIAPAAVVEAALALLAEPAAGRPLHLHAQGR